MPDEFQSTGPDIELEFGVTKFTFTLEQLVQVAESFVENGFSISHTYAVAQDFIWPKGDAEFIIEFIEDMDHIRRGEFVKRLRCVPSDWIDKLKTILCLPTP